MSNQQIPPAVRGCQLCGCPAEQIKLLGNPVAEVMRDLRMCNRYCPICTAQAPIAIWDGTDLKCIAHKEETQKDFHRKVDEWNALKKTILSLIDATFENNFGMSRQQLTDEVNRIDNQESLDEQSNRSNI